MVQLPLFADDLNIRQEVRNTERNKKRVQFWFKFLASAAVLAPLLTLWFLFAFTQKQQIAQQQTHLNDITQHIANNLANSLTQEGANTLAGALQSPQVLPLLMQAENDLPEIANFVLVLADNNVLYSLADTSRQLVGTNLSTSKLVATSMPKATEQEYRTAIMASTDQELLPLLAQLSTICKTIPQHNNTINLWLCAKHDPLQWQINSSELQIELITLSLPFFLLTAFMLYGLVLLYRQQRHTLQLLEQQRDRHFENSRTDPLTGAYSRAAFNALYSAVESHYHRNNLRFALFYVDIDHFKNINDQHGHDIGDQVLSVVTSCLQHAIRPNDYLVRLGGDEFAVIGNFTEQGQAQVMAEKLRELVMLLHFRAASGEEFSISISIGCYLVSKRDTMLSAQKHADQALYIAKRRGRNQVYCFSAEAVEQLVTSVGNDTFTQP